MSAGAKDRLQPRILLLHGYLSGPTAWTKLRAELVGDAVTYAPPLPGYGSEAAPLAYTLEAVADALEWRLAQTRPTHLLGHSMGAILALELARRYPGRFARVGLVGLPMFADAAEGLAFIGQRGRAYDGFLRNADEGHAKCVRLHRTRYLWAPLLRSLARRIPLSVLMATFDHAAAAHAGGLANIVFSDLVRRLAEDSATPIALLHGAADRTAPIEPVRSLGREWGWPLRLAGGASHQLIFERPRGTARWVRERLLAPIPDPRAMPVPSAKLAVH